MNRDESILLLFVIAKEIKRSFESPVIFLTLKDYADSIFNSLVEIRSALLRNATPKEISEIINTYHLEWLQAVQDIENFKKRAKDTPREIILQSIDYTIECVRKRHEYFQRYIEHSKTSMTLDERNSIHADIAILGDMRDIVKYALNEKQKCLRYQADKIDFYVIIMNEIEELMNWLDGLYNHLSIKFSKVLNLKTPLLSCDLTKTLKEIIDEVAKCPSPENQEEAVLQLSGKSKKLGFAMRVNSLHGIEISKIIEKIKNLEDRINRLKTEDASSVVALEHKTMYLKERLQSLQNLKLSINCLRSRKCKISADGTVDEETMYIFNHLLPQDERCRLVEQLVKLWKMSIEGDESHKSIISILSAADIKEVFSDELGHFSVDKYGRKIYSKENDDTLYQRNEQNELVPVDDEKHVYFYDDCGRYYVNELRERVYKAHAVASEYLLHSPGYMLKVSEFENDLEYRYDNLGRYYIDFNGSRIYKDKDSDEKYQHDGLGNLVLIRDVDNMSFFPCPLEPMVTSESKYLKVTVGAALKKCVAEVVSVLPTDPIKYLADRLEKYRKAIEIKQILMNDEEALMVARREYKLAESQPPSIDLYEPEESVTDLNFTQYETALDF